LDRALRARPAYADTLVNLSWAYLEKGEPGPCLAAARQALRLDPRLARAHNNAGSALLRLGRPAEAAGHFREAVEIAPEFAPAAENLGLALIGLRRLDEAVGCLRRAARLDPARAGIPNNLALALTWQGRWEEAVGWATEAVRRDADFAEAHNNLGLAYLNLHRPDRALAALGRALALRPDFPEALSNLGWALTESGDPARAEGALREALRLRPDFPEALNNLALACHQLDRPEEARDGYERALRLRPDFPEALGGLANVYRDLGRLDEALACYRRSLALDPRQPEIYSSMLFSLHYVPGLTPGEIFAAHRDWARHNATPPATPAPAHPNDRDPGRRLRVGYVSADFRAHVMGRYIEPVLECHDRRRFEVFCYANVGNPDDTTRRIEGLAGHWRDIRGVPDGEVEAQIRRDAIDLLIDLGGHTANNRLALFARKPAPVQASHFGYMETTGLDAIDYRITDAVCDPPGLTERYHTERLVRLPEIAWCYRPGIDLEPNAPPAGSAGQVTIGMFNAFPKITAPSVRAWAEVLRRLPDSRLLVLAGISPQADRRLLDAFAACGIGPGRVQLVGQQPRPDYFRLYHRVDLALDAFPYAGCNTTCDALWMGVPVVTLAGANCIGRQGASPLAHLGLHELITDTVEEYVETAVRLASNLPRLERLRATLRERMRLCTLMNPRRFTRQLEEAYRWMWHQWCHPAPEGVPAS
jgi:predicted O-linked N-acetylglucosamine transferase (SPINDLY family)